MKNNHEIILKQYAAYCKEQPLYLGTAGSYGMEMLTIIREGVWAEYDILAAFHPPVGAAVQVRVGANNQIGVPIEATAEKGMGEIVFAGYKEGVRQDCGRRTVQGGAVLWCERYRTRRAYAGRGTADFVCRKRRREPCPKRA